MSKIYDYELWALGYFQPYSLSFSVFKDFINHKENQQKGSIGRKGQWPMWFKQTHPPHLCFTLRVKERWVQSFPAWLPAWRYQRRREASGVSPKSEGSSFSEASRKCSFSPTGPDPVIGLILNQALRPGQCQEWPDLGLSS